MRIPRKKWDRVELLASKCVAAIDQGLDWETSSKEVVAFLRTLRKEYGDRSVILASLGDYANDPRERLALYERAFEEATREHNLAGLASIATSATRCCLEHDADELAGWRGRLVSIFEGIEDTWEKTEAKELLELTKSTPDEQGGSGQTPGT